MNEWRADVQFWCWQGGTIKTSLNVPAQSFYQSRKTLLDLCDRAGISNVIFYCGESSFHDLDWGHWACR